MAVAILFALALEQVATGGLLTYGDCPLLRWITQHRASFVTDVFRWVTVLGNDQVVGSIVAVAAILLLVWRRWQLAALVTSVPLITWLLTALTKELVARPRPTVHDRLVSASGPALPSGHASTAVACYVTLTAVLWVSSPPGWRRAGARWAGIILALAIGCSRVYLGAHWPSDVVGGWLIGAAVLLSVATAGHVAGRGTSRSRAAPCPAPRS